jgi:hypothetical protein
MEELEHGQACLLAPTDTATATNMDSKPSLSVQLAL